MQISSHRHGWNGADLQVAQKRSCGPGALVTKRERVELHAGSRYVVGNSAPMISGLIVLDVGHTHIGVRHQLCKLCDCWRDGLLCFEPLTGHVILSILDKKATLESAITIFEFSLAPLTYTTTRSERLSPNATSYEHQVCPTLVGSPATQSS